MLLLNYVKLDVPGSGLSHSIILSTYYILQICWMQSFGTVCIMVTGSFVSLNRKVIEVLLISGLAYTGPWVKVETKDLSWSLGSWKSSKEGGSRKRPAGERPPPPTCGGEALRSCAKLFFGQWMGCGKAGEKSFVKGICVASSQDECGTPECLTFRLVSF